VVKSREADTWAPHDVTIACQLAKALATLEKAQAALEADGLMMVNDRGTTHAHPLLSASMTMSSTIQALTRTLGLGASQRGLAGSKQASRNQADQAARKVIEKASADGLLA
jgi:phage terminase small subunit